MCDDSGFENTTQYTPTAPTKTNNPNPGSFISWGAEAPSVDCTSEQLMVDMIRQDLGVVIEPQAWRMFVRHRFERISPLAHRIHDGKR